MAGGYRERASTVPGVVAWTRTVDVAESHRILPDGCLDIIAAGDRLFVAGPDTTAQISVSPAGESLVALRFAPAVGPAFLGVPAAELRDLRVPLEDLWSAADVRRLRAAVAASADPVRVLEELAGRRLGETAPDPAMRAAAAAARQGLAVEAIAARLALSPRQLRRRSDTAFGYGLKTLARIARMERALALARAGRPWARVAADAGYADQPHLTREVRALTGVTPTELI